MKRRVVVTGLGAVTSLSCRVDDLWQRILPGRKRHPPDSLRSIPPSTKSSSAAKFSDWTTDGYISAKDAKRLDRFTQFAMVAGIDAVSDSGLDFAKEDPFRCGVILGTGIGGLNEIETQHARLLEKGPDKVSAFTIPKLMVNAACGQVSIQFGLRGPSAAVATACASATNAIGDSYKAIQYGDADIMVTGGTEAALTPMGISGFANMRALSEMNDSPQRASRPFDRDRDGFVLSEGAGLLVLEELEHAKARGARIYAEVLGYGLSADAGHITHPDEHGTGAAKAMSDALRDGHVGSAGHHAHQRPRHQHAAGRPGRDGGRENGLPGARPRDQHLEHQEPVGAPAGGERWRRVGAGRAGVEARRDPAHDQLSTRPTPPATWTTRPTRLASARWRPP